MAALDGGVGWPRSLLSLAMTLGPAGPHSNHPQARRAVGIHSMLNPDTLQARERDSQPTLGSLGFPQQLDRSTLDKLQHAGRESLY